MGITLITDENRNAFDVYMPHHILTEFKEPDAIALGAFDDSTEVAAGVIAARTLHDRVEIIWIFINEEYRGRGYAAALLDALIIAAAGVGDISALVAELSAENEVSPLRNLFKRKGFSFMRGDMDTCLLTVGALAENPLLKNGSATDAVLPLRELPRHALRILATQMSMAESGMALSQPVNWDVYDGELSVGYVRGTELRGILLLTRLDTNVELSFAYAAPGEKTALLAMLRGAAGRLNRLCEPDTKILIAPLGEPASSIVRKMFPDSMNYPIIRAIYQFYRDGGRLQ